MGKHGTMVSAPRERLTQHMLHMSGHQLLELGLHAPPQRKHVEDTGVRRAQKPSTDQLRMPIFYSRCWSFFGGKPYPREAGERGRDHTVAVFLVILPRVVPQHVGGIWHTERTRYIVG